MGLQDFQRFQCCFQHLKFKVWEKPNLKVREKPNLKVREKPNLKVREQPNLKVREQPNLKVSTLTLKDQFLKYWYCICCLDLRC